MSPRQNVAIRVQTEGKADVKRDWQEIGQAGASAHQQIGAASDQAGDALDRQMVKWKTMAQAAKESEAVMQRQAAFNTVLGVGGGGKSAAESAAVFEAMGAANGNMKLSTMQMQELTHSARAFFDVIAAGGSPTRALAMESGRLAQTLGAGSGGVMGALKGLATVAVEWGGPAGAMALVAGGIAIWIGDMLTAKARAEDLKKSLEGLTQTQHAGMEAISRTIDFSQKYKVSTDGLYTSLENVISSQGHMNDVVQRGVGVTDAQARAARDRAEAERLLTVELLRQASVEATKRAGDTQKKLDGLFGAKTDARVKGAMAGFGLDGPEGLAAAQDVRDQTFKSNGGTQLEKIIAEEKALAQSLTDEANALAGATLTVKVRNEDAEAAARKAEEAARKAAAAARKAMEQELALEAIRVKNLLELARLRGDKAGVQALEQEAHAQELINQYIHAGLTEERARHLAMVDGGKEELALAQGRIAATIEEAGKMKTLAQLTVGWEKVITDPQLQDALDSFRKSGESAFETLGDKLTDTEGKMKSWGDTIKGVIAKVISDFEKLALINPMENFLFGQGGPLGSSGYQAKPGLDSSKIVSFVSSLFGGGGVGHNANGTDDWAGGWSEVGERGPERVWMPPGSKVMSNARASMGMGGSTININMDARGADASAARNVELQLAKLKAQLPGLIIQHANEGISRGRIVAGRAA